MAAQAYPLIRELSSAGTLAEWLRFAEQRLARGRESGVIICEREPYIRGLFGWEIVKNVSDRRLLVIRHFCVPGVLPPRDVMEALLDAIEALAQRLDCSEINVEMPLSAQLHPAFAERGLFPGSVGLYRHVVREHAAEGKLDA